MYCCHFGEGIKKDGKQPSFLCLYRLVDISEQDGWGVSHCGSGDSPDSADG